MKLINFKEETSYMFTTRPLLLLLPDNKPNFERKDIKIYEPLFF